MTLERLALGSIPADLAAAFAEARGRFFAACTPYGSAYAVAAGIAVAEARAYVEAFAALSTGGRMTTGQGGC